jgi:hypothetical protein
MIHCAIVLSVCETESVFDTDTGTGIVNSNSIGGGNNTRSNLLIQPRTDSGNITRSRDLPTG